MLKFETYQSIKGATKNYISSILPFELKIGLSMYKQNLESLTIVNTNSVVDKTEEVLRESIGVKKSFFPYRIQTRKRNEEIERVIQEIDRLNYDMELQFEERRELRKAALPEHLQKYV